MRCLIIISLIFTSISSYAEALKIRIEGKNVYLDNALSLGDSYYTLSQWIVAENLAPTKKFIPGMMPQPAGEKFVKLNGPSVLPVKIPLAATGRQYNLGSNKKTIEDNSLALITCEQSHHTGNLIQLNDNKVTNCITNFTVKNENKVTPFYFHRPIFEINKNAIVSAFEGKPEGTYYGSIRGDLMYYYESFGNALTYRVVPLVVRIVVDYKPSSLESINFIGNGILEPTYDTNNKTVSAETTYNINAMGYFTSGLTMTLIEDEFLLRAKNGNTTIPLSIKCEGTGCQDIYWVKNGKSNLISNKTDYTVTSPTSTINFSLLFSYKDIRSKDVESDTYEGHVTVIFEELL
ncbi:hypothetical protein [Vibrio sp. AND4]|uniref:hypothetical protein n=1 Tax=Vibrio sp. AND4 TaxID=314289 RepID=UPI00015EFAA6|nr:hypothetical protein [Vibrio sp. AND4]EDP60129.1 hypothetical protein AND4_01933 [Vibrio sp. AND4]